MARKLGPKMRHSRRFGQPLIFSAKEAKVLTRRGYPPGQHGPSASSRISEYGLQLREKQKAKLIYGVLERQFRKYFEEAFQRTGDTGEILLQMLERRLDNIVYRAGFGMTRAQARQFVTHGHVQVNGRLVDIPSARVRVNDIVTIRPQSLKSKYVENMKKTLENHEAPAWVQVDKEKTTAKILAIPSRRELELNIDPQLIVEFYSR
ncbi:MAG: 30S ribosomal protein S4 [Candidatus Kerfeldbacteria bacterium]|nr:30S ribosomal protein S4 [Candidatus Kerfeldbacteria bacterium]